MTIPPFLNLRLWHTEKEWHQSWAWAWGGALAPESGEVHIAPSVGMGIENNGLSGWNMTRHSNWNRTMLALMAFAIVFLTFVMILRAVGARGLPLSGGVRRGPLLQQLIERHPPVQGWPLLLHLQPWDLAYFMIVRCLQDWRTSLHLGLVLGGAILGQHIHVCLFLVEIIFTLYTLYVIFQLKHILIHWIYLR